MDSLELEAKFWLPSLHILRKRAIAQNASLVSPRHLERNLRFDTAEGKLANRGAVLRLRQAERLTLTFKQPGEIFEIRQEWEIEIDDLTIARKLLEALGYVVIHVYEKYREVFRLDHCQLMLDEVPYGCFAEIEGPDLESIQTISEVLQLNWKARIRHTYLEMFEILIAAMEPKPANATFSEFTKLPPIDLAVLNLSDGYLPPQEGSG
jgi:adenylate cyclase class 2